MSGKGDYFSQVDAGKPVLAGHRSVKRKLVAPLSDLPSQTLVNTTADIFPELLWISLIFERYGYHQAVRIAAPFRKALADFDNSRSWYRISEISQISKKEWRSLSENEGNFKENIISSFIPLLVYPQLPLKFMRGKEFDRDDAIETLRRCVGTHFNRFETPGAATIGTFVFLEAYAGHIRVPREVLEGLNSIVDNPGSVQAEIAASGARALLLAFWGADADKTYTWPAEFWRENLRISACHTEQDDG